MIWISCISQLDVLYKVSAKWRHVWLTLYPSAADGTQEVGIQTVRLLDFVQQLSDIHHLKKNTIIRFIPGRIPSSQRDSSGRKGLSPSQWTGGFWTVRTGEGNSSAACQTRPGYCCQADAQPQLQLVPLQQRAERRVTPTPYRAISTHLLKEAFAASH